MVTSFLHRGQHPRRRTGRSLRRLAALLAAAACGLLAWAATIPAAYARPDPSWQYRPVPAATTRVITVGGMAGWQITLIALGAALAAAATAVLVDRALAARRSAHVTPA